MELIFDENIDTKPANWIYEKINWLADEMFTKKPENANWQQILVTCTDQRAERKILLFHKNNYVIYYVPIRNMENAFHRKFVLM